MVKFGLPVFYHFSLMVKNSAFGFLTFRPSGFNLSVQSEQACLILILMLDSKVGRGNFCPLSIPCHEKMTGTLLVNLALHSFSEQGGSKQIPSIIRNFKQKSKCFI